MDWPFRSFLMFAAVILGLLITELSPPHKWFHRK